MQRAFKYWNDFPFTGGVLKVDGKIIGYIIAEELDGEIIDTRFEKAFISYSGSYQALYYLFLQRQASKYVFVNREEDMGMEGLRVAKMSYRPSCFVKKYRIDFI